MTCPRCSTSAYDEAIDYSRAPMTEARDKKRRLIGQGGCAALLLAIPTLGLSLAVFGLIVFMADARDVALREAIAQEAAAATRRTCRACGLAWYEAERESLAAGFAQVR